METGYIFTIIIIALLLFYFLKSNRNTNNDEKDIAHDFLESFQPSFDKLKLMPIFTGDIPALLMNKEYPVLVLNCDLYEERNHRNFYGGSVSVAKGVSLFAGQSRSKGELQKLDNGSLIITDKRLIFIGNKRNTNTEYDKLLSLECYDNCVTLHKIGKSKSEVFFTPAAEAIKYLVDIFLKYQFTLDDDKIHIIETNKYDYGMKRLLEITDMLKNKTTDKDSVFDSIMKFIEDVKNGNISNSRSRDYLSKLDDSINKKNS